jgi:hypothetical protein
MGEPETTSPGERSQTPSIRKRFEDLYYGYLSGLQTSYGDAQRASAELCRAYVQGVQEAWTRTDAQEIRQKLEECYNNYVDGMQKASEVAQQSIQEVYGNYTRRLQAAWAELDVNDIDSAALSAIGQSSMAVSAIAHSTPGNWWMVGSWGWNPHFVMLARYG